MIEEQIEKLRTLQESYDALVEESQVLKDKIDNIQFPEVDLSQVAKQGENPDATNSKILEGINKILSRSAVYNETTGNLTIENVSITIE